MDAGGRATQEQLPSLHVVNEHFFGKFNDARASEVIFQSFPKKKKRFKFCRREFNPTRLNYADKVQINSHRHLAIGEII
jgi:hypothetical protein